MSQNSVPAGLAQFWAEKRAERQVISAYQRWNQSDHTDRPEADDEGRHGLGPAMSAADRELLQAVRDYHRAVNG
jgi:hypothetical protein